MNSVDDSTVVTPADTSNLSSSESTSSNSQPTVKLRLTEPKKRQIKYIDRTFNADGHDPFIQTLDKDGRHLIETTGRTAQRSRASIRDTSRYNESCKSQNQPETSRFNDNSWPNYNYQPRKCRSTTNANCHEKSVNRRVKKRHSYGAESSRRLRNQPEFKETPKRYSAGDYLRQQILEDLNSNEIIGKTDQQIAQDRCNRIMAYLRRRTDDSPYVSPETRLRELRDWSKFGTKREKVLSSSAKANRRKDIERIRSYLQDKIRAKMNEEEWRNSEMKRWSTECPNELSLDDIRMRFSDYKRVQDRGDYATRRVRSDNNVRLEPSSSDSEQYQGKLVNSIFKNGKGSRKSGNICRRTRSDVIPEKVIDFDDNEVKIRFYSFLGGRRNSWMTKSASTFEKKLSLPSEISKQIERENEDLTRYERNECTRNLDEQDNDFCRDKNCKKYCRRTRSDTVTRRLMDTCSNERKTKQRSISWSDKRKLQKKTSTKSFRLEDSTSVDSEIDSTSRRREKNALCSWREYKERRRHDQLRKELANIGDDENLNKVCSVPEAWKNFQQCYPDKMQPSLNTKNTQKLQENNSFQQSEIDLFTSKCRDDDATKTNENISTELMINCGENSNDTETETILQENYLLLDRNEDQPDDFYRSPTISRLQVNEYRDQENSLIYGSNEPDDVHYDPIIMDQRYKNDWIKFNGNSNVKKSDTFKIVDGSEKTIDEQCQNKIGIWNFDTSESSWLSNYSKCSEGTDSTNATGRHSEADDSQTSAASLGAVGAGADADAAAAAAAVALTNKDIATDYFRRVYELLKQRQEDARRETPEALTPTRHDSDTSNYDEQRDLKKRRRRRKKDKNYQGEDLVTVSSGVRDDDDWRVQRILVNNDPENLIFRRPQLQNVTGHKRPRHPAPPIPANCKINAKDISKYFDYPNKENSPRSGVNENGRSQRNESIEQQQQQQQQQEHRQVDSNEAEMGSNLSRHNGKGLTGRRTQSSGNLCDPKGKLNHVGKILVPCSSSQRDRYKICGSLPNHLDDKEILDDDEPRENNNTISDSMGGIFGGTLPHKKRSLGVHFSDSSPTGTLDLVKHRSQDSLEGDPWRYQEGVDLDLVRCKHGKLDVVEKTESADVVDGEAVKSSSSDRYGSIGRSSDRKCFRGAELDLVGTLPKRRTGDSAGGAFRQSFEARQNRWSDRTESHLPIKVMHKPDCELMKHHQFERVVDVKLSRLAGGEPQDQGYASERSPEDEHPPSLPGQPFPKVIPENAFIVTLQKSSRGLGLSVSGGGTAGPVRVKRLFPQQPAALSKKLEIGDILLAANGVPLTGLTNYEALEVLRTTPSTVELVVCRVPGDTNVTSPGAPPPPPARREPPSSLRILNPQPSLQIEPCGEFDIEMTKVGGSLGFTLRKVDSSALGHYVRALVREPALSDGRIQPGDKIVSVDGAPLSPMSHEEAVALLRQCGPRVKLRLYRDLAQTPVSALSPTEPDHPLRPPRTSLRQEAVDMLCDLAVRKLSPDTSNGSNTRQTSGASCHSPRRLRKPLSRTPTADNHHEKHLTFHAVHPPTTSQTEASDTDQCSINTQTTNSQSETPANDIIDPPSLYDVCDSSDSSKALPRPSFLDLSTRPEKPHFRFSLESESDNTGPIIVTESDSNHTAECDYDDDLGKDEVPVAAGLSSEEHDNNLPSEPASMPPLLSATPGDVRATSAAFSYKNPAYQSANPTCGGIDNSAKIKTSHSSDHDIPGKVLGAEDPAGSKGLLKWKGVMFAPNDEVQGTKEKGETEAAEKKSSVEFTPRNGDSEDGNEVLTVELTRGWNSRLGFSLQPEDNSTVISVVHPDSVAAKDGRLMEGDVLIMVNDENVENIPTAEIIDLLRKIRGSIGITVIRKKKRKTES